MICGKMITDNARYATGKTEEDDEDRWGLNRVRRRRRWRIGRGERGGRRRTDEFQ